MSASAILNAQRADPRVALFDQTLAALETAQRDNLDLPSRRGNIVVLTPDVADDVVVSADLHGHRENFRRILQVADLDRHPRRHLVLHEVVHGGPRYEDGGCRSHAVLEGVAQLKVRYPGRIHFILSNHELSELTDYPITKAGNILLVSFRMGIANIFDDRTGEILAAYKRFIRSCPLAVRISGGAFVSHSAPEFTDRRSFDTGVFDRPLTDADLDTDGPAGQLVWGRDYRWPNADRFAELVEANVLIHGHTPCQAGYAVPNPRQVILDCSSQPATVAILPVGPRLDRDEVLKRIVPL